jgi:hypothetical protein
MLMERFMTKTELNSCIIYVIGIHMVSVTLLYLIGTKNSVKQCQISCDHFGVRILILLA